MKNNSSKSLDTFEYEIELLPATSKDLFKHLCSKCAYLLNILNRGIKNEFYRIVEKQVSPLTEHLRIGEEDSTLDKLIFSILEKENSETDAVVREQVFPLTPHVRLMKTNIPEGENNEINAIF